MAETDAGAKVYCHYRYSDTATGKVLCTVVEGDSGVRRFSIPPNPEVDSDNLTFWLEVAHADGPSQVSETVKVPRSEEVEVEVSGQTDVELTFPLEDWEAKLHFNPCCLIVSGWIQAERIPVLPTPTRDGLPEILLAPFFRIDPDELVEATGGVYVEASYGDPARKGADPETIQPYQWKDGRWTPVFDSVRNAKDHTVKFHFARGGLFAIGGNSSKVPSFGLERK